VPNGTFERFAEELGRGVRAQLELSFLERDMSTIQELGAFLSRESAAAGEQRPVATPEVHPNGAPAPA
jgi:hypothetical protein